MRLSGWMVLAGVMSLVGSVRGDTDQPRDRFHTYTSAGWSITESENFRFRCRGRWNVEAKVIRAVESLRCELATAWLAEPAPGRWKPKCDIVLHTTAAAYLAAVPGGDNTVGSSVIDLAAGRVARRRIDIRADRPGWLRAALGHELTHVVLADRFTDGRLPAWADEGMAVLADSAAKQEAHRRDLHVARSSRRTFRLVELFALAGYPPAERQAAFYGQSASLVRYLVSRGTREQFVRFVGAADKEGFDSAVRDIYGLRGVSDLERHWLQYVGTSAKLAGLDSQHRP